MEKENLFSLDPNLLINRQDETENKLLNRWQVIRENAVYPIYAIQLALLLSAFCIIKAI